MPPSREVAAKLRALKENPDNLTAEDLILSWAEEGIKIDDRQLRVCLREVDRKLEHLTVVAERSVSEEPVRVDRREVALGRGTLERKAIEASRIEELRSSLRVVEVEREKIEQATLEVGELDAKD